MVTNEQPLLAYTAENQLTLSRTSRLHCILEDPGIYKSAIGNLLGAVTVCIDPIKEMGLCTRQDFVDAVFLMQAMEELVKPSKALEGQGGVS